MFTPEGSTLCRKQGQGWLGIGSALLPWILTKHIDQALGQTTNLTFLSNMFISCQGRELARVALRARGQEPVWLVATVSAVRSMPVLRAAKYTQNVKKDISISSVIAVMLKKGFEVCSRKWALPHVCTPSSSRRPAAAWDVTLRCLLEPSWHA